MTSNPWLARAALTLLACAAARPATAQQRDTLELPPSFRQPMRLYTVGLGPYSWRVTTRSREAQAFYEQEIRLVPPEDAARSFREAQKHDSACAMCYLGEAWAWGPYLNGPMPARNAPRAFAAALQARKLSTHATPLEQALIAAMSVRYQPVYDSATHFRLARVYADSLGKVYARHPRDPNVATMYAKALFLLEPRRGTRDVNSPRAAPPSRPGGIPRAGRHHPGACHLYVHATESTSCRRGAEACAEFLGRSIPGASHINHMPSHTWNESAAGATRCARTSRRGIPT